MHTNQSILLTSTFYETDKVGFVNTFRMNIYAKKEKKSRINMQNKEGNE